MTRFLVFALFLGACGEPTPTGPIVDEDDSGELCLQQGDIHVVHDTCSSSCDIIVSTCNGEDINGDVSVSSRYTVTPDPLVDACDTQCVRQQVVCARSVLTTGTVTYGGETSNIEDLPTCASIE